MIEGKLKELRNLYGTLNNHIDFYHEKRAEFIRDRYIKDNECELEYESENYLLVQNIVKKFLKKLDGVKKELDEFNKRREEESRRNLALDSNQSGVRRDSNRPSITTVATANNAPVVFTDLGGAMQVFYISHNDQIAERITEVDQDVLKEVFKSLSGYFKNSKPLETELDFVCGFVDVIDAIVDKCRDIYLNKKGLSFKEAFEHEATIMDIFKKMCQDRAFIRFEESLDSNFPPMNYDEEGNRPILFSRKEVRASKQYLATDRVFGSHEQIRKDVNTSTVKIHNEAISNMNRRRGNVEVEEVDRSGENSAETGESDFSRWHRHSNQACTSSQAAARDNSGGNASMSSTNSRPQITSGLSNQLTDGRNNARKVTTIRGVMIEELSSDEEEMAIQRR